MKKSTNPEKTQLNEKEIVEHYGTTLYPSYIEKIKALAYYDRCSQREVIEKCIDGGGYSKEEKKQAVQYYKKHMQEGIIEEQKENTDSEKKEYLDSSKTKVIDSKEDFLNRGREEFQSCAFFMSPKDAEVIRAVAEIQGKPQGEFISFLIDGFIEGKKQKIKKVLEEYRRRKDSKEEDLF